METAKNAIRLGEVEIACWSIGEGKPIIVLGGPWFGHHYVQPLADQLAHGFRVIAYDPRGSGLSSALAADQITLSGHLDDLEGLRHALGIEHANLVGHSFGALVCLLYAAQHPETAASLVLANPGPPFDSEMQEMLHHAFVQGHTPEDKKQMEKMESSPGFTSRDAKTLEEYFKVSYSAFFEDRRQLSRLDFGFTPTTAQYVLEAEEQLVSQLLQGDPAGQLRKIACPTLVVHAEHDLIPEAFSRFLADSIRDAEYALLEGVGHFAYLENPGLFKGTVVPFLQRNAR